MHPIKKALFCLAFLCLSIFRSEAANLIINPSDDGALYTCQGCNTVNNGSYLLVAGYIQGIAKFPLSLVTDQVTNAILTVNAYGLPLHGTLLDVYGIVNSGSSIIAADANAGIFLGTYQLPANPVYGQDIELNVTAFVASAPRTFVGFNLRNTIGTYVFSSKEINYGHPAQLKITTIPEPSSSAMFMATLTALAVRRRRPDNS